MYFFYFFFPKDPATEVISGSGEFFLLSSVPTRTKLEHQSSLSLINERILVCFIFFFFFCLVICWGNKYMISFSEEAIILNWGCEPIPSPGLSPRPVWQHAVTRMYKGWLLHSLEQLSWSLLWSWKESGLSTTCWYCLPSVTLVLITPTEWGAHHNQFPWIFTYASFFCLHFPQTFKYLTHVHMNAPRKRMLSLHAWALAYSKF